MIDSLFLWDNPTPPEWSDALRRVYPAGDRLSNFEIVWEPGEPQAPIQRYVIWQMRPKWYTQLQVQRQVDPRFIGLIERHPREHARWDANGGCYRLPGGKMAKTDRLTWELYHRTGQYGQRWWVIQGPHGGHRYALTGTEKRVLGVKRGTSKGMDTPFAGDLPYAPFDERTLRHLRDLEAVARWHKVCAYADAQEAHLDEDERREAEQSRALLADWLDNQFGELWQEAKGMYKEMLRNDPMASKRAVTTKEDRAAPGDNAAWKEQFVQAG